MDRRDRKEKETVMQESGAGLGVGDAQCGRAPAKECGENDARRVLERLCGRDIWGVGRGVWEDRG